MGDADAGGEVPQVLTDADLALADLRAEPISDGQRIGFIHAGQQDREQAVFKLAAFIHVAGHGFE